MQDLRPMLKEMVERRPHAAPEQAHAAIGAMLDGSVTDVEIAALLTVLAARGETVDEVTGVVMALRERLMPLPVTEAERAELVDTCGTGGDGCGTFNISTAAALVAAAAGAKVAKHGNRALTSRCGSADVLEALGVPVDLTPELAVSLPAGAWVCLSVRANVASHDAARAAGAAGAGVSQYVSSCWAVEQSSGRTGAVDGRVRAGEGGAGGGDDGAAWCPTRLGSAWRGRIGRADANRPDNRGRGAQRWYTHLRDRPGRAWAGAGRAARPCWAPSRRRGMRQILEAILSGADRGPHAGARRDVVALNAGGLPGGGGRGDGPERWAGESDSRTSEWRGCRCYWRDYGPSDEIARPHHGNRVDIKTTTNLLTNHPARIGLPSHA